MARLVPRHVRQGALPLLGLALALIGTVAACGSPVAEPTRTIPAACLSPEQVTATATPGTDTAGLALPPATVPTPTVSMPPAPVSELQKIDIKVGDGAEVKEGDTVKVNYVGWSCSTGKQFDTSYGKEPVDFALAQVIPGWGQGMVGMKVGGQRVLIVPGSLAYNASNPPQAGSGIETNDTLAFVIDLLETGPTPVTTTTGAPTTTAAPTGTAAPSGTAAP